MSLADRLISGPSLSDRLSRRAEKAPVAGGSVGFRARFGLLSDADLAQPELVSAAPWAAMMARVAQARARLMDRGEAFFEQHGQHRLRALERMWPETRRSRSVWDTGVYRGQMVLPEKWDGDDEDGEAVAAAPGAPRKAFVPHRPVANPWGRSLDRPARVARGTARSTPSADERAVDQVSRDPRPAPAAVRAARPVAAPVRSSSGAPSGPARRPRALDRAASRAREISLKPSAGADFGGVMSRNETPGAAASPPASRHAASRLSAPARPLDRLMAPSREAALPDRSVSPVAVAAGRIPEPGRRPRGLRRSMASSPSVELVTALPDVSADVAVEAAAPAAPKRETTGPKVVRQPPSQRAAARGAKVVRTSDRLASSPVTRSSRSASRGAAARSTPPTAPRRAASGAFVGARVAAAAAAPSQSAVSSAPSSGAAPASKRAKPAPSVAPASRSGAAPRGIDALLPGPSTRSAAPAGARPEPAPAVASQSAVTSRVTSSSTQAADSVAPASSSRPWRRSAAHAAERLDAAVGTPVGRSVLPARAGAPSRFDDALAPAPRTATQAALARAEATGDRRSVLASPVTGDRPRFGTDLLAERSEVGRAFSIRRMASGVFGPDTVMVEPDAPATDLPSDDAPAAAPRTVTVPPPVVSGFADGGQSPAAQANAARAQRAAARANAPVAQSTGRRGAAASATRHALDRAEVSSAPGSVLPQVSSVSVTRDRSRGAARAADRSAVRRADARRATLAGSSDRLLPAPLGHLDRRLDAASVSPGASRRMALSAPDAVVPLADAPVAASDADASGGSAAARAATAPMGTVRTRPTTSAAARATRTAARTGAAARVASARGAAPSSHTYGRPGPMAHARPARSGGVLSQTPVVEIDARTAERLGIFDRGTALAGSGEWLVEGDLASAVQRAAARTPARAARRGSDPRASTLRGLAPGLDGVVTPGAVASGDAAAQSAEAAPSTTLSPSASGAPVRVTLPRRPLDWADERSASGGAPAQRPSAGAHTARTAGGRFLPARRVGGSSQPGAASTRSFAAAGAERPLLSGGAARRGGVSRSQSSFATPDAVLPQALGASGGSAADGFAADGFAADGFAADGAPLGGMRPGLPASGFQPGVAARAPGATGLSGVLGSVGSGSTDTGLPVWAQRASGRPLVRGTPGSLVHALARADSPEDVVRVIVQQGEAAVANSTLPRPVTEVIGQIRDEAADEVRRARAAADRTAQSSDSDAATVSQARATARTLRGMTGLRKGRAARAASGVGADQVSRLAKKLQGLIHLAEGVGDRDAARRQVRMAEEHADARAEGQGAGASRPADDIQDKADIDALTSEVLEAVNRELELRRERRQEESDGNSFWW